MPKYRPGTEPHLIRNRRRKEAQEVLVNDAASDELGSPCETGAEFLETDAFARQMMAYCPSCNRCVMEEPGGDCSMPARHYA